MAVTQPAWKVGDPSPAGGGELVRYRPATKQEWDAYTHRETPSALPPRVDNATPAQIAELGELWVDERTGYKARVKPDEHADQTRGREAREREERGTGGATGDRAGLETTGDASQHPVAVLSDADKDAEIARLRAQLGQR